MEDSVDLTEVARNCPDSFTGADLQHLVDKTAEYCLDEQMDQIDFEGSASEIKPVRMEHFDKALKEILSYHNEESKVGFRVMMFAPT